MNSSREFQRIVSWRSFLRAGLFAAFEASLASAVLLSAGLLSLSGGIWLAMQSAGAGGGGGFLRLESIAGDSVPGRVLFFLGRWNGVFQGDGAGLAAAIGAGGLAIAVSSLLAAWSSRQCARVVAAAVQRQRQHLHRKAIRLEPADLTGDQGVLMDRLFRESAQQLEERASLWAQTVCLHVPALLVSGAVAFAAGWQAALQTIIPLILGRYFLQRQQQQTQVSTQLLSEQAVRGLQKMAESLQKARLVSSFGMEQQEQRQFELQLEEWRDKCEQLRGQQAGGGFWERAIQMWSVGIPLLIVCLQVQSGLPLLNGILLGLLLLVISGSIRELSGLPELSSEGSERAEEIAACIDRVPSVSQRPGAVFLQPMSRTLTFNQVTFRPSQSAVLLDGLDLRISFGERVALLSLQPEPALAVASLIPRFIDPDPGQVLIDGRDIREGTLESLRAEALYVGGDDAVFDATALENITCGRADITRQQALEAAKQTHADNFIRTLSKGYETPLGEHGVQLDAGQRFRLSLARAAVREPAIMIIEEPAAAMDAATKSMLDDAYQRLSANRTMIFLPTRLSTVKRCSRVIVIHEGKVAADGTHEQLLHRSDLYRHWEYVRFNPFRGEDA
jgi:ABC-type multidrug transport system fused ATPase/permease subunit